MVGDLFLRLKQDSHGKLESPWVGPYIVIDYKTRRQEKMRATHGMKNSSSAFMHRRSTRIENYDL
jgi:hypothetical protein